MPPKRKNNLQVAKSGRVEIVNVEDTGNDKDPQKNQRKPPGVLKTKSKKKSPKGTKTRAKKKDVDEDNVESIEENLDDNAEEDVDIADCESINKKSLTILEFLFFVVEIDFSLGTRVFGYRDLKTGKFQPCSNYSFTVDAFCDGKRFDTKK